MHRGVGKDVHACSGGDADIVWDWMYSAWQKRIAEQAVAQGDVEAKAKSGVESDASYGRTYQEREKLLGCA